MGKISNFDNDLIISQVSREFIQLLRLTNTSLPVCGPSRCYLSPHLFPITSFRIGCLTWKMKEKPGLRWAKFSTALVNFSYHGLGSWKNLRNLLSVWFGLENKLFCPNSKIRWAHSIIFILLDFGWVRITAELSNGWVVRLNGNRTNLSLAKLKLSWDLDGLSLAIFRCRLLPSSAQAQAWGWDGYIFNCH